MIKRSILFFALFASMPLENYCMSDQEEVEWGFLNACYEGSLDKVKSLRPLIKDLNFKKEEARYYGGGYSETCPLHRAIKGDHLPVVKFLIANGADVNINCRGGEFPLDLACFPGKPQKKIIKSLLEGGANPNQRYAKHNYNGINNSFFHVVVNAMVAGKNGISDIADLLIKHGADVNIQNNKGTAPLHCAAKRYCKKSSQIASDLIGKGARVDITDKKGRTPLHRAAQIGFLDMMQLLIENGADVNAQDEEGLTPIQYAEQAKFKSLSKDKYASVNLDDIRFLVENGASINSKRKSFFLMLMSAIRWGKIEDVEFLINNGVDIHTKDDKGETPLEIAVKSKRVKIAELLIEAGADVNQPTSLGESLLYSNIDFRQRNPAMFKLLIENGADEKSKLKVAPNVIFDPEFRKILFQYGDIDVAAKNKKGETLLHQAASILSSQATIQQMLSQSAWRTEKIFDLRALALSKVFEYIDDFLEAAKQIDDNAIDIIKGPLEITMGNLKKRCIESYFPYLKQLVAEKTLKNSSAYDIAYKNKNFRVASLIEQVEKAKDFQELPEDIRLQMIENSEKWIDFHLTRRFRQS